MGVVDQLGAVIERPVDGQVATVPRDVQGAASEEQRDEERQGPGLPEVDGRESEDIRHHRVPQEEHEDGQDQGDQRCEGDSQQEIPEADDAELGEVHLLSFRRDE